MQDTQERIREGAASESAYEDAKRRLAELPTEREELAAPSAYQRRILFGLNLTGKHIYAGTVPAHIVAKRRARNKVARASRRANRGSK